MFVLFGHLQLSPTRRPLTTLHPPTSSLQILKPAKSKNGDRKAQFHTQPSYTQQKRAIYNVSCFPRLSHPGLTKPLHSTQKNPDDVVITLAIRTPLTKGFKGGLKDTPLDFLVYQTLKKVIEKSNVDPQLVEDVCLGNVSSCAVLWQSIC